MTKKTILLLATIIDRMSPILTYGKGKKQPVFLKQNACLFRIDKTNEKHNQAANGAAFSFTTMYFHNAYAQSIAIKKSYFCLEVRFQKYIRCLDVTVYDFRMTCQYRFSVNDQQFRYHLPKNKNCLLLLHEKQEYT